MNSIIELKQLFRDCPDCWKNFLETIQKEFQKKDLLWDGPHVQVYINQALKPYHAIMYRDQKDGIFISEIQFESEKHKTMFILKWTKKIITS